MHKEPSDIAPGQRNRARQLAGVGYGWEDISVKLEATRGQAAEIRAMVLRGGWWRKDPLDCEGECECGNCLHRSSMIARAE